ncbi:hypothetical protein IH824_17760 [candidate division KSB1 bacterium]|nr:hypothetical protein [candidate division KSB1 bacterium]
MKVKFLSVAELEFAEAVEYYNQESEGLGFKFALESKSLKKRVALEGRAYFYIRCFFKVLFIFSYDLGYFIFFHTRGNH